ncbi:MAG TPA: hypothetical protein VLZ12_02570 [Verrucomicrobiae bacterium]|nr:hypothetical protein [Verrucomicrobiae bacterium]
MKRSSKLVFLGGALIVLLGSGCAHTLEVKNLSRYEPPNVQPLPKRPTIGIVSTALDITSARLVREVDGELSKYADVTFPYMGSNDVQFVADIGIASKYKGSGINFLINFPGFLIFTPAWHGYVYNVYYDVDVSLTRRPGGERIDSFSLPIYLSVRQANINRTWTEISWLEVGIIAFVGGIVFVRYDDNVTPLLLDKVGRPLGVYIAKEILSRVANAPPPKVVEHPAEPPKPETTTGPPGEPVPPPKAETPSEAPEPPAQESKPAPSPESPPPSGEPTPPSPGT